MTTYDDRHSQYIAELFAQSDEALQQVWEASSQKGLPPKSIQTIYPAGDGMVVAVRIA